jgi:AraC-like DNA-binding protein
MIHPENNEITYLIDKASELSVRWYLLESGCFPIDRPMFFSHPTPAFNRIFLFRHGGAKVKYAQTEQELEAGRVYLLPINQTFEVTYRANSELYYFHLTLQESMGLDVFTDAAGPMVLENVGSSFGEIIEAYAFSDFQAKTRWQTALFQITCRFAMPLIETNRNRLKKANRYHPLLEHIQKNCRADLTVNDLADRMKLSRSALSKGFQRTTGIALKKHLSVVLLQRAKEKLAHTDETIKQMSAELGFTDPTYFHRFFKQKTGQKPLEYRYKAKMIPLENNEVK